ncbi:MAG TPA: ornithine cyclodeaminase family protein [Dehalococcoidia bacterium]|nr:ornithine cyclodeaminase family protein [Dehalococcoidia bacterium]
MLYINRDQVAQLLNFDDCVKLAEEGLAIKGRGEANDVPRIHLHTNSTNMMFLPSMIAAKDLVGMRIYNVGGDIHLMYLVWDGRDGRLLAMMDAMWIRDIRTGSVGAVSAKYLARPNSKTIGVLGSGRQSRSGLIAHTKVFKLDEAKVFSRSKEHREAFAREMEPLAGIPVRPVDSLEEAIHGVDIITTGTAANAPSDPKVLKGAWLEPGQHISCIGGRAELEDDVVTRADRVIIDSKAQFPYEATDITAQVNKGLIGWDDIDELHDVVAGNVPGRKNDDEIILVKTVGTPLQDLLPAAHVYQKAVEKGIGQELGDLFPPAGGWFGEF